MRHSRKGQVVVDGTDAHTAIFSAVHEVVHRVAIDLSCEVVEPLEANQIAAQCGMPKILAHPHLFSATHLPAIALGVQHVLATRIENVFDQVPIKHQGSLCLLRPLNRGKRKPLGQDGQHDVEALKR